MLVGRASTFQAGYRRRGCCLIAPRPVGKRCRSDPQPRNQHRLVDLSLSINPLRFHSHPVASCICLKLLVSIPLTLVESLSPDSPRQDYRGRSPSMSGARKTAVPPCAPCPPLHVPSTPRPLPPARLRPSPYSPSSSTTTPLSLLMSAGKRVAPCQACYRAAPGRT